MSRSARIEGLSFLWPSRCSLALGPFARADLLGAIDLLFSSASVTLIWTLQDRGAGVALKFGWILVMVLLSLHGSLEQ